MFSLMKKLLPLLLIIIVSLTLLCACDLSALGEYFGYGEPIEELPKYKVMLSLPEGVSVKGDNPVMITEGDAARFYLEYEDGYMFNSVTDGYYDVDSQVVVISGVYENINSTLTVNKYDFDTTPTYRYIFRGTGKESTSVVSGIKVNAGIVVKLEANDNARRFVGWTVGAPLSSGGTVISKDRNYSFIMHGDLANDLGAVIVYPNYTDSNAVYYHPNGGSVNPNTVNFKNSSFYTASMTHLLTEKVLRLQIHESYFSKVESHSSLYDDGTFYRTGYVLKEYNTRRDGTGESYSLGSKVYFSPDEQTPTLYCIWEQATPEDAFTYTTVEMPCPVKRSYAPDWCDSGIIISSYTGNAKTLVIPEVIDGKPVIAIASGAIVGKDTETVILNRRIQRVENGAIRNCPSLKTVYYADSIYEMYNEALDAESYSSLTNIYVNATLAPRYAKSLDGAHAIKLSRLLAGRDEACIIAIGGSSIYEGLATEYLEALMDGDYRFVNFGTTRTTHCTMYLEAMSYYAGPDDIVVYWKSLRDLEGMNNIYRHVDMSQYTNFFSAYTDFNQNYRYKRAGVRYEHIATVSYTDENGDHTRPERQGYVNDSNYLYVYYPSLNNRTKSRHDVDYKGDATTNKEDYNNPNNETWCSIDDPYYLEPMNRIIGAARSSGAKVYFAYCPCDADSLVEAAKNYEWLRAYDKLIAEIYDFDGVIGKCEDYIYNHLYFFDCAFHLNDYGRTYRTYQFYLDLCETIGRRANYGITSLGESFDGCLFEQRTTGKPRVGVDYLTEG